MSSNNVNSDFGDEAPKKRFISDIIANDYVSFGNQFPKLNIFLVTLNISEILKNLEFSNVDQIEFDSVIKYFDSRADLFSRHILKEELLRLISGEQSNIGKVYNCMPFIECDPANIFDKDFAELTNESVPRFMTVAFGATDYNKRKILSFHLVLPTDVKVFKNFIIRKKLQFKNKEPLNGLNFKYIDNMKLLKWIKK